MKLYEIDERISALVDPETGEIADYEAFESCKWTGTRSWRTSGCGSRT